MENSESFYKRILDNLSDGVYFLDTNRTITYWNRGAERITGYRSEDVLGRNCRDNILVHVDENGKSLCLHDCPVAETLRDGENRQARVFLHHRDGHRVPVLIRVSPILDERGKAIGAVEIFRENGADEASEDYIEDLKRAALLDPLTGLANRRFLDSRLTACLEDFKRHGFPFAVVLADIDHFKKVNDTYGHAVGDEVLKMVASTLKAGVRVADTVGRWGGEEFLLILQHLRKGEARTIADKLRVLVEQSFLSTDQGDLRVTISMGSALYCQGETLATLLERADRLLYEAKATGRNRVVSAP